MNDDKATIDANTLQAERKFRTAKETPQHKFEPTTQASTGLTFLSLLMGMVAGLAIYFIADTWLDKVENGALAATTMVMVFSFTASWLMIAEPGRYFRPLISSIIITAIISLPTYFVASHGEVVPPDMILDEFPAIFWFLLAGPIVGYLMIVWAKAAIQSRAIPAYQALFFHGLTVPLISMGASLLAGLALALLFAWAALMKSMGVSFFLDLFEEAYFSIPFAGAMAGLAIAMLRAQQSVLGALRYILLLFSRILMPITALLSLTFIVILAAKGTGAVYEINFSPASTMIALAFAGMLIFNGVYQNGEGSPPNLWLRLSTILSLIAFPVYSGLATHALWIRVSDYGLTPARIGGLTVAALAFAYSIVCIGGLVSELNWRTKRWMPLVAPLNTLMVAVWIVTLIVISSPLANPWAISAHSQEVLLSKGKISAKEFEFDYLWGDLGKYGKASLDRLYQMQDHPEIDLIRLKIDHLRSEHAANQNPIPTVPDVPKPEPDTEDTPMTLELNPNSPGDVLQDNNERN